MSTSTTTTTSYVIAAVSVVCLASIGLLVGVIPVLELGPPILFSVYSNTVLIL